MAKIPQKAIKVLAEAAKTTRKTGARAALESRATAVGFEEAMLDLNKSTDARLAVQDEVAESASLSLDTARLSAISNPKAPVSFNNQARTPEEFQSRLRQFRDEAYSVKATATSSGTNLSVEARDAIPINLKYKQWDLDNQPIYDSILKQGRVAQELRDFASEGVLTREFIDPATKHPNDPAVLWHLATKNDPRRKELGEIPFGTAAFQTGLNTGSKRAGQELINPNVVQGNLFKQKEVKKIMGDLDELAQEAGFVGDVTALYEKALKEVQINANLRAGEGAFDTPNMDMLQEVVKDFISEYNHLLRNIRPPTEEAALTVRQLQGSNATGTASRLRGAMSGYFNPRQFPFVTDVKQGLHVVDLGDNSARSMARDQVGRGTFSDDKLNVILGARDPVVENQLWRDLLDSKGYDVIIQHNGAEDKGVVSFIIWDEKHIKNLYEVENGGAGARAATAVGALASVLGLNNADIQSKK
jgi:hypothetical protein